ncbi:hypothetical protein [Metallibacterium sp.]|uniref:hypothetical protein n=1 Tax=Metallibacterium sp. TaxID=2940281 RepID=UPI002633385C|nr:hypothetical protein [Metallibacterium sp.]
MRTFLAVAIAVAIGVLAAALFATVVPLPVAAVLGITVGIIELVGSARGQSIRVLLRVDALLLAWPVAALLLYLAGMQDRGLRISIAAGIAAVFAGLAAGRGSGDDDTRMRIAILSVLIVGYSIMRTLVQPLDPWALVAASAAAAVPLLIVSGGGVVLPRTHKTALRVAAYFCVLAAAGEALAASGVLHAI